MKPPPNDHCNFAAGPFGLQFATKLTDNIVICIDQPTPSKKWISELGLEYDESAGYTIARRAGDDMPFMRWMQMNIVASIIFHSGNAGNDSDEGGTSSRS